MNLHNNLSGRERRCWGCQIFTTSRRRQQSYGNEIREIKCKNDRTESISRRLLRSRNVKNFNRTRRNRVRTAYICRIIIILYILCIETNVIIHYFLFFSRIIYLSSVRNLKLFYGAHNITPLIVDCIQNPYTRMCNALKGTTANT